MFCKNCGANIPDTAKFCKECGTPVVAEPEVQAAPVAPEAPVATPIPEEIPMAGETTVLSPEDYPAPAAAPEMPAEEAPAPKKKSKAKPIIITIAIIVAVLGILAGLLIGLRDTYRNWGGPFPYIANTVDKMFLSEKEYSEKVAKNAVEGGIESIKNTITEVTNPESSEKKQINLQNMGLTAKTKIEVDQSLLALVEQAAGVDLSFLKSVEIVADVDSASNAAKIALEAKLNDKSIANLSAIADFENTKTLYLTLPGLSESAAKIAIPEEEFAELTQSTDELKKMLEKLDIEAASNVIIRVLEVAMEQIDEYETKNEKLTVEGVSVNATKVVIKIDEKMIKKVIVAVLEELEGNEDLKKVMKGVFEISGEEGNFDEIWDEMKGEIGNTAEMIDELDLSEMDLGADININLWVDGKGEIIGFGAEADVEGVKGEFRAVSVVNGSDEAIEAVVNVDMPGMEDAEGQAEVASVATMISNIGFSGKGTRTDGKLTGEYTIKAGDKNFVEFSVENANEAGGTYTIKLGKGAKELVPEEAAKYLGDAAIKITTESTDTTSKFALEVIYAQANLVKFSGEVTFRDLNKDFSVKADKTYDLTNESEMMQFAQTIDIDKLLENVKGAGIPLDELMGMIMGGDIDFGGSESVTEPMYPSYDMDFEEGFEYEEDDYDAKKEQASENVEYFDYAA